MGEVAYTLRAQARAVSSRLALTKYSQQGQLNAKLLTVTSHTLSVYHTEGLKADEEGD
jgi:hypothetical protein